jgi:hypothetical protein
MPGSVVSIPAQGGSSLWALQWRRRLAALLGEARLPAASTSSCLSRRGRVGVVEPQPDASRAVGGPGTQTGGDFTSTWVVPVPKEPPFPWG